MLRWRNYSALRTSHHAELRLKFLAQANGCKIDCRLSIGLWTKIFNIFWFGLLLLMFGVILLSPFLADRGIRTIGLKGFMADVAAVGILLVVLLIGLAVTQAGNRQAQSQGRSLLDFIKQITEGQPA
jgi:hypothetical protein